MLTALLTLTALPSSSSSLPRGISETVRDAELAQVRVSPASAGFSPGSPIPGLHSQLLSSTPPSAARPPGASSPVVERNVGIRTRILAEGEVSEICWETGSDGNDVRH